MKRLPAVSTRVMFRSLAWAVPALLLISAPAAMAQDTWNYSLSDLWNTAGNWSAGVPGAGASVVVTNTTNNPVLINTNPSINNLTIGGTSSVSLNNAQSLTITGGAGAGSINIAAGGTLTLSSTANFTDMILSGSSGSSVTLSGGGTLTLLNNTATTLAGTTSITARSSRIQQPT